MHVYIHDIYLFTCRIYSLLIAMMKCKLPNKIKMISTGTPKALAVSPFGANELIRNPIPNLR